MSLCTDIKPLTILSTCFDINYSLVVLQFFVPVALRPDSGSWPSFTGLYDQSLDAPQLVGLLWMSGRYDAETST